MTNTRTILISIVIGMLIGMLVQCIYDVRHPTIKQTEEFEKIITDTLYLTDTVSNTVTIAKYYPTPTKEYIKLDTVYLEGMEKPIQTLKTHKVYNSSIDTVKTLQDTIKYRQTLNYYITTTDRDVDTIQISAKEDIPLVTRYIEKEKIRNVNLKPKWTLSVGVGAGVGLDGKITPNIGVTFGYPILSGGYRK